MGCAFRFHDRNGELVFELTLATGAMGPKAEEGGKNLETRGRSTGGPQDTRIARGEPGNGDQRQEKKHRSSFRTSIRTDSLPSKKDTSHLSIIEGERQRLGT